MNLYVQTCTCIRTAVTADLLSSNEESILENKKSLEDEVWPSGVNCGIGNQDVNPRPRSFTVCPFLPLYFLSDGTYRGNV